MQFEEIKKNILARPDKSKKGSIDEKVKELCAVINSKKDFYTSSSCAGRIVLLELQGRRKDQSEWIFATHDLARVDEVKKALNTYDGTYQIFFVQQAAILHVGARTLELAQDLVEMGIRNGFKRSGIIATRKKIIVELLCTEHLSAPVFDGKKLVADEYVDYLVNLGNTKLEISWKAIERLKKAFENVT